MTRSLMTMTFIPVVVLLKEIHKVMKEKLNTTPGEKKAQAVVPR